MTTTVLLSGGIDSSACVAFHTKRRLQAEGAQRADRAKAHSRSEAEASWQDLPVRAIFVDYGQAGAEQESRAATNIAAHYQVPLVKLTWSGGSPKGEGLIHGRNAFLLFAAVMEMGTSSGVIALGVHAGTDYYDCTPGFLKAAQTIFDAYTSGLVRVSAPFLDWSKRDVWEYCRTEEVPIDLTYSCELGLTPPCGRCRSCRDLEALRGVLAG